MGCGGYGDNTPHIRGVLSSGRRCLANVPPCDRRRAPSGRALVRHVAPSRSSMLRWFSGQARRDLCPTLRLMLRWLSVLPAATRALGLRSPSLHRPCIVHCHSVGVLSAFVTLRQCLFRLDRRGVLLYWCFGHRDGCVCASAVTEPDTTADTALTRCIAGVRLRAGRATTRKIRTIH